MFPSGFAYIREMMACLPYQACMGNHEQDGLLFTKYFPYPYVANRYWSFDYGPVHFAVVDQYVPYGPGSAQLTWLENDLASTDKPWKIVYLHEPGWSAGGHGNNTNVQNYIHPLLVEHAPTLLFAGHNHYYARAVVDDVHHITTGGGGAPLYSPTPTYPYVVAAVQTFHFCTVEIDGEVLHFEAINTGSSIIDSFTVVGANAGADPLPEAPNGFALHSASPSPFNSSTVISFAAPAASDIRLEVFDIEGRKVKTLVSRRMDAGLQSAVWDGTDESGRPVSPGAYFYRLTSGDVSLSRKVVKLR
jgi:hypothetical protein